MLEISFSRLRMNYLTAINIYTLYGQETSDNWDIRPVFTNIERKNGIIHLKHQKYKYNDCTHILNKVFITITMYSKLNDMFCSKIHDYVNHGNFSSFVEA